MSDEQTELLEQILAVQKEHLAFARSQHEETKAVQRIVLTAQRKAIRMARILCLLLLLGAGYLAYSLFSGSTGSSQAPPAQIPIEDSQEIRA
jgi:hypothetical protein